MILRILNKDISLRSFLFVVGEGMLIYAAVMTAAFLSFGNANGSFLSPAVVSKTLIIAIVCQASLYFNELYNPQITDTYLELGLRLIRAIGVASIILAIVYYHIPSLFVGRGVFFISLAFIVLFIIAWRHGYNWILKKKMFIEKILVLGSGDLSLKILDELHSHRDSGYQVAGMIPTNSSPALELPKDIPIIGFSDKLFDIAESNHIKKIVVALDDRRGNLPVKELLRCKMNGMTVLEGESFYEKLSGKILAENVSPSWFIFSEGFRKSRLSPFLKRISDLAYSCLGLIMTLPLTIIILIAIKLDSKGPVIYKQKRCGQGGRPFELLKFRSMIHNAEESCGPVWAQDNDCRVTRVGNVLRKFRLDEIPQMWNVLRGDMSFVGPRPERPEFVGDLEKIVPYYAERHTVKPGITGWAQVSYRYGASVEDALEKLKYDLFYIKNMSIVMDLMIIFITVKIVLNNTGVR